ncbi:putative ribosomal protein L1 [Pseudocohnilembus persalinus]|uniref:Large ribosomal subunit protein uL1c n=1 Tax=Pseudocohnilembus persalinus TaxID=266149 RepID=A0A0V0QKZ5_PSEPJ|nr:putative ribosomal protein L1 [Pseudocohnilembus persalinus]|eukprot:KRX02898.1 putative ribosomal protein L1 [Pseudocohnilembus persalinus]
MITFNFKNLSLISQNLLKLNKNVPVFNFAKQKRKIKKQSNSNEPIYNIYQALKLARVHSLAAFDETIDVVVNLTVNPKHGNQIVRGVCNMPGGVVKQSKICVFTNDSMIKSAQEAGADFIGSEQLLKDIKDGKIEFDKLIATADQLPVLKPFARQLGPKGLMPNAKTKTLVQNEDLTKTIQDFKQGQVTYRVDIGANIHAPLGKMSFTDDKILLNFNSLLQSLLENKPQVIKGLYYRDCYLKTTMGPSWKVNVDHIDPRSKNFVLSNI